MIIRKKSLLFLFSIFLIAGLAISMIETVSAYNPTYEIKTSYRYDETYSPFYKIKNNELVIDLKPSNFSTSEKYNTTINLGSGKKINIQIETRPMPRILSTYNYHQGSLVGVTHNNQNCYVFAKISTENTPNIIEYSLDIKTSPNSRVGFITGKKISNRQITFESYPSQNVKPGELVLIFDSSLKSSSSSISKNSKLADLKISKVSKKGNTHTVHIKNIGQNIASKSYLGIYDGETLIKRVVAKSIGIGKTTSVKVSLAAKYKNKIKTFKADYTNVVKESNEKNNILKAK
ncbi:MAG: hypothetical protein FWH29_10440 [Methanobrevibacter sp.]|nr:hypothetical protein [Methanobrevibacter sp.]